MYREYNRYRILTLFFDEPHRKYQLRELERESGISLPSVRNHVKALEKGGFVEEVETGVYKGYKLADNRRVRAYKRNDLLIRLEETGLVDEIEKKCRPNCIVLFGSAVEGRDDERGDVDIFVQSKERKIDLDKYEEKLNRSMNILFEPKISELKEELVNSLANGITLRGFLKVT